MTPEMRAITERQQQLVNAVGDAANNLALDGQRELAANLRIAASEYFAAVHLALAPVSTAGWQPLTKALELCTPESDYLVGNTKDGAWIATWRVGAFYPEGGFFPVSGYWSSNDEPTAWMPLPAVPEAI